MTYLRKLEDESVGSFFTGIPEMEEMEMNEKRYQRFVRTTCRLLFEKVSLDGISLMFLKISINSSIKGNSRNI